MLNSQKLELILEVYDCRAEWRSRHEPFVVGDELHDSTRLAVAWVAQSMRLVTQNTPPTDLLTGGTIGCRVVALATMECGITRQSFVRRHYDRVLCKSGGILQIKCEKEGKDNYGRTTRALTRFRLPPW